MNDVQRILVPVDFSEYSRTALRYARGLATKLGAQLALVHVFQIPVYALPDGALITGPETMTRLSVDLSRLLKELAETEAPGAPWHLVEGVPTEEILRLAKEHQADLIVMGTHGRTGLKHLLIGSVAERVVRTSPVPVLTVPTVG